MPKFFVYAGYVNCDTDIEYGPTHIVKEFYTAQEVEEFYEEFVADQRDDNGHVIFRVFTGEELLLEPVTKVTQYKLRAKS